MTDKPDDNAFVLRLELHVPLLGGLDLEALRRLGLLRVDCGRRKEYYAIQVPAAGGQSLVRIDGNEGYICAKGTAKDGSVIARRVHAKIYAGGIATLAVPGAPPANDPSVRTTAPDAAGNWAFQGGNANEIPGGQCANVTPSATKNSLVVWYEWNAGNFTVEKSDFFGVCSTRTDCDPAPGGNGGGGGNGDPCPIPIPEPVAEAWAVVARGFGGAAKVFNSDRHVLKRVRTAAHHLFLWHNGNDADKRPRVELTYDCTTGIWQLRFRLGRLMVDYRDPDRRWNPVSANGVVVAGTFGLGPDDAVPAGLIVEPHK